MKNKFAPSCPYKYYDACDPSDLSSEGLGSYRTYDGETMLQCGKCQGKVNCGLNGTCTLGRDNRAVM